MLSNKVSTTGQLSFEDLTAIVQSSISEPSSILPTEVSCLYIDEQAWEAMFAEENPESEAAASAEEGPEDELEIEFDFEEETEPAPVLNIRTRSGKCQIYTPKSEPEPIRNEKDRIAANINAIREMERLNAAGTYADATGQDCLAAYSGWEDIDFEANAVQLSTHFSDDEIEALKSLPMYPYSLSQSVSHILENILRFAGFTAGNTLLYGTGNGSLLRALPEKMVKESRITIAATDALNGALNSFLAPETEVVFCEDAMRESYYDAALALIPIYPQGTSIVAGRRKGEIELPNYAASMLRIFSAVRPGGFAILIMESQNPYDEADLRYTPFKLSSSPLQFIGGLRLANDAFADGRCYDILVFHKTGKKVAPEDSQFAGCPSLWEYFTNTPDMVIGESPRYVKGTLILNSWDEAEQLAKAESAICGWGCPSFYEEITVDSETEEAESLPAYPNVKNYSMVVIGSEVYQRIDSRMVKQKLSGRALQRVKGMITIRNQARKLIQAQLAECSDEELAQEQKKLNALYDAFVAANGPLTSAVNLRLFREDAEVTLLTSLEYTDEEEVIHKADIFSKRTIKMRAEITDCDTPQEAYTICLNQKGCVDIDYMASLCKMEENEIIEAIAGSLIFREPTTDQWAAADEYLSGNVVQKLEEAKAAAETDKAFEVNVKALQAIQPPLIPSEDIDASLSSPFISESYLAQFLYEVIGEGTVGHNAKSFQFQRTASGSWKIRCRCYVNPSNPQFYNVYGTTDYSAVWLVEHLINQTPIVAMKDGKDAAGKKVRVKDTEQTVILQEKCELIAQAFQDWIFSDPVREAEIVSQYNQTYNNYVVPQYDGSHLTFPGMTSRIELKPHQKNAVYRIIRDNGALIGHVVGSGKTITLLAAGMELKRLGRISKPLYLVPNNLLAQWGGEMMRLYPTANILLADPDDMRKQRRKRFLSRIATGDYDAVFLGSSSFSKIPAPSQTVSSHLNWMGQKIFETKFPDQPMLQNPIESLPMFMQEDILKNYLANEQAEYNLEELGIDYLFVDESHEFKNLRNPSGRGSIRGLSNSASAKCTDLYYKTKYLNALHHGKGGFTFATGTAIVNSITELYSLQRYFQEDLLFKKGIISLDSWISLFGNVTTEWELPPEGLNENGEGFRQVTRISSFKNVPELMKMFLQFMDTVTRDDIDMDTPDEIHKTISCPASLEQKKYMGELVERANLVRSRKVKRSEDNMLAITVDGRKAALDIRIVNPAAFDSETNKVSQCARQIMDFYRKYQNIKGTQVVFSDISTPNQKAFNIYSALKQKLVSMGMPEDEIAFAHDFKTPKQQTSMRLKMQTGRLRVLIGSTATIGQGANIQNRLIALHNLDVPWVPKDIEQRLGRIVRPGNMNARVFILNYVTEGSFDAYMWQTIEVKAKLIAQILRGDYSRRTIEDSDTKALTYSEIKAIATGDTRFLQRAKLEGEIARLETLKRNFENQRSQLKQDVHKNLPKAIETLRRLIPKIEQDAASILPYKEAAVLECRGVRYILSDIEQLKAARKALPQSLVGYKTGDIIGTYNGLSIVVAERQAWTSFYDSKNSIVVLQGRTSHRLETDRFIYNGRAILDMCHEIAAHIPDSLDKKKEKLHSNEMALDAATALLSEPFEQEDTLMKLKQEYEKITLSLIA